MALPKPSPGLLPADNYLRFGRAFDAIDTLDTSTADIARALSALQQAVGGKADASAVADLLARILRIYAGLYPAERPGDTPVAFTASRAGGDPDTLPPLDTAVYPIRVVGDGLGVEVSGSREVWERTLHAAETTRLWRGRWRYVRTAPSQDPSGDSIVALVQWYGADRSPIGSPVQVDAATPAVGTPREFSAFIGISGATGVTVSRPGGAVYFRVGLKSYGVEGRTVLTDLHASDVSDIDDAIRRLVPPDALPALSARIDDLYIALDQISGEVVEARGSYDKLATRLLAQDQKDIDLGTQLDTVSQEIVAGRGGNASLAARLNGLDASVAAAAQAAITSGEITFDTLTTDGAAASGAVLVPNFAYSAWEIDVPAGQTGQFSYLAPLVSFSPEQIRALVGTTLVLTAVFDATADFLRDKPISTDAVRVFRASAGFVNGGVVRSTKQVGNKIVRVCSYSPTADDLRIGVLAQIGSTSTANAHVLRISSVTWDVETTDLATTGADLMLAQRLARELPGIGPVYDDLVALPQYRNGGAPLFAGQPPGFGFKIPANATGQNTLAQFRLNLEPTDTAVMAGRTVMMAAAFSTSSLPTRALTVGMITYVPGGGTRQPAVTVLGNVQISTFRRLIIFTFVMTGDEIGIAPYFASLSSAATSSDETFTLTELSARLVASPNDVLTLAEENARIAARRLARKAAVAYPQQADTYAVRLVVKADTTGDFLTPKAAMDSITDASPTKRYEILICPPQQGGLEYYDTLNLEHKNWVDMRGTDRQLCWLRGYQAPNTPLDQVSANSTINIAATGRLFNLRVTGQNLRYPVHSETNGTIPDRDQQVIDCYLENFGNQEVRDYVTSQGGDPNQVFATSSPWGFGNSSGQTVTIKRSTLKGSNGFYIHTNKDFDRPSYTRLEDNRLICNYDGGPGIVFAPLGSGRGDTLEMIGNEVGGGILFAPIPWLTDDPALQIADRAYLQVITGYGNTPMAYDRIDDGARALRIESASTGASSAIVVGGNAVAAMLGRVVTDRSGGGLPGAQYGTWEVAGVAYGVAGIAGLTTLGRRLGDCRTTPKPLTVRVDGGTTYTVTFNQNHTNQDNPTVLGIINGVLGSAATASLMDVTERWRPRFRDEETEVWNGGTAAIRRKRAVAYLSSQRTCRPMTASDPASAFAGIAYDDIPPGATGRVKTRGLVRASVDLVRSDSAAFVRDDSFGLDANGLWVKNAATPLLWAVNQQDVALPDLGRIAALRDQLNSQF